MSELLRNLQADPRTASLTSGAVIGDTTQVVKKYSHKIPGVPILFVHSEKIFAKGLEVINTHYADWDKDYPLFMTFYQPDEAVVAERTAKKKQKQAGVDGRKPSQVLAYLKEQITGGNKPELVTVAGPQLGESFIAGLDQLGVVWLGVSSNQRVYTLKGSQKKHKAKILLAKANPPHWVQDPDLGYRFASLGSASSRVGQVQLVIAEHMADKVRTLYLVSADTDEAQAIARISLVLSREQAKQETGILTRCSNYLNWAERPTFRLRMLFLTAGSMSPGSLKQSCTWASNEWLLKPKRVSPTPIKGRHMTCLSCGACYRRGISKCIRTRSNPTGWPP